MRALLQHPELVYRIERAGAGQLSDYELAARLSFLLWGSTPDEVLLAAAGSGALRTPEGRREQAVRMLADRRALERWDQFHAFWLGYFQLPHPAALSAAMRAESKALVDQIAFSGA